MGTKFLDQLAEQLKVDRNAACRRAIERMLAMMKKRCADGEYGSRTEAALDFRKLVKLQSTCRHPKPKSSTVAHKFTKAKGHSEPI
jgi:hypothetical protein